MKTKEPAVCGIASFNSGNVTLLKKSKMLNESVDSRGQVYHISGSGGGSTDHNKVDNMTKKPCALTHLPQRPPVDISFTDVSYCVPDAKRRGGTKHLLSGVSGSFHSKELTAIMGPSGAGKSTLMNILAGYKVSGLSGIVCINGKERNLRSFRKTSCYIMQDDQLMPHLTVLEAMNVSANLKLGNQMSNKGKLIVIEEILETLGLVECRDTRTSNLSGGQRKRLSIALELVNNPPIMFFDEPTSGLDSSSCFQCVSLLKSLSRGGRTIICTIHQPSARLYEMFDHLYTLAEGQCIYEGSVNGLVPFLSTQGLECPSYHNPADYVMEVASGEHGDVVDRLVYSVKNGSCKNWNHTTVVHVSPEGVRKGIINGVAVVNGSVTITAEDNAEDFLLQSLPASSCCQFWILLKRSFVCIMRDQTLTRLRLLSHILVGLLIGMIYWKIGNEASKVINNAGCLFFTVLFLMFTAMMPTILTFPMEMSAFIREHLNHWYSLKAFYLAKTVADLPFQIVFSVLYVSIVYFMTAQPAECSRFFMVMFISILTSLVAQSLGLFIGAAMSVESGVFLGPVSSVPILLFSGFFVNLGTIPDYLQWLADVSYLRYGFEGIMISIYGSNRSKLQCSEAYCHFRSPKKFLEEMDMANAVYWIDCVALSLFFVLLRTAGYLVLRLRIHSRT